MDIAAREASTPIATKLASAIRPADEDRPWLAAMAGITAVELTWWAVAWEQGFAPLPYVATYLGFAFVGLSLAIVLRLALGRGPSDAPWPTVLMGTVLTAVGASAFLPLKFAIPNEVPFWLDQPLAAAERALFGSDPWLVLDRLFGWATVPLDWLYGSWLPVQSVVLFSVILMRPSPEKTRALIAYVLAWFLLGILAAMLLSSAGPIFYDRLFGGSRFAGLGDTLRVRGAWLAISESDGMWASLARKTPGLVAGISAAPSMHVAIGLWIYLTARTIVPRAAIAGLAYLLLVWVGSVQLGWHYFSDGLLGTIGMLAVWQLARVLQKRQRAPSRKHAAVEARADRAR